jgi:hypothetical protein
LCLKILAAISAISFSVIVLGTISSNPGFEATNYYGSEFARSAVAAPLVGFSASSYILRTLFQPIYIIFYPIFLFSRDVQGYQYLLGILLFAQFVAICRLFADTYMANRLPFFVANIFILSLLISAYPIPNLRYFIVFIPSLVCLLRHSSLRGAGAAVV